MLPPHARSVVREFFISHFENLCDLMDSCVSRLSKAEKRKRLIERIAAKEKRLEEDKAREADLEILRRAREYQKRQHQQKTEAEPFQQRYNPSGAGQPNCPHCGNFCAKTSESQSGCGCLIMILGLVGMITVIGFPVGILLIVIGLVLALCTTKRHWTCRSCGIQIPRR